MMKYTERLIFSLAIQVSIQVVSANTTYLLRPKVVGGSRIKVREVPFILSFHSKNVGFLCGATILSASWGVTALHCVIPKSKPRSYYVRAGSSMNNFGGTVHNVAKFYFYDLTLIDSQVPRHDIALFKVKGRFRFSANVKPAKLPRDNVEPPNLLRIAGWGETEVSNENIFVPGDLQAANLSKVTWPDCFEAVSWYSKLVEKTRHLCYGEKNKDACYGDSGGPLADSQAIYGIVTFGDGCARAPGIYVNVLFYKPWIKKITKI